MVSPGRRLASPLLKRLQLATCFTTFSQKEKGFYNLIPEIKAFGEGKMILPQFDSKQWMADITAHLSTFNRTLKGKDKLGHD